MDSGSIIPMDDFFFQNLREKRYENRIKRLETELAGKDKLIEQMLEALEMADELIDQLIIDNTDNYAEERAKIRTAIAAAKGEV